MPTNDLLTRIASNLRVLRRQRGVTREQLAATADVDPQMIKRIEAARANPALVVLSRLASALMISASLILSPEVSALTHASAAEAEPFEAETVGDTLTALRKHRHMSRRALAKQADLRAVTLSRYESATADARILAIAPISAALGIDAQEFVRAIESRQRQVDLTRGGWHSPAPGVEFRLVTAATQSQLWEWRLAPSVTWTDEPQLDVTEEIATAIRGDVRVAFNEETRRLRRGGSLVLPTASSRSFTNAGQSTARLLRFQVTK